MGQKEWEMPRFRYTDEAKLENAGYTPLLSAILQARGIDTPQKAREYLKRDESLLKDPFLLDDMDKAIKRIELAITRREKVAVYGDYDVDGITAACLLSDYFSSRGLECETYIPDRLNEGYGVNTNAIRALHEMGVSLIITVDCGVTAILETEYAKSLGMDIIVSDHHECPPQLPAAIAVINPKRKDSKYPPEVLAGVGVAFKLVCALEGDFKVPLDRYADFVAVGTIADVMPLNDENRVLVQRGLDKLRNSPRPGFAMLLEESGAALKPISAQTVSFVLAPRINAAGRLSETDLAVKLLLSKKKQEARTYARALCDINRRRQELETAIWEEAKSAIGNDFPKVPIVLKSESWHPGVVGIASSRITEEHKLPTIMICLDGDLGKGSCRSSGGFNLFDALTACSEHLESFGGHAFAAGINIRNDKIEAFKEAFTKYYIENPPDRRDAVCPELLINDVSILDMEGVQSLDDLEPCGSGNPRALLCISDAVLESIAEIGNGKHLRMRILKDGVYFDCVYFSHSLNDVDIKIGECVDVCFFPQINHYHSYKNIQLLIDDIRPSETLLHCRKILKSGEICLDKIGDYRPGRDEITRVWRIIDAMGGRIECSLDSLIKKDDFGGMAPIMLCLCLRIFKELGLLSIEIENEWICIFMRENAKKADLASSPLFRLLWQDTPSKAAN